jgi:hypothetical protein
MPVHNERDRTLWCAMLNKALGQRGERHRVHAPRQSPSPPKHLGIGEGIGKCRAVPGDGRLPHVGGGTRMCGRLGHAIAVYQGGAVRLRKHCRRRDVLKKLQPRLRIEPPMVRRVDRAMARAIRWCHRTPPQGGAATVILVPGDAERRRARCMRRIPIDVRVRWAGSERHSDRAP